MEDIYIIDAKRTAVGKYGGSLSLTRPDDMLAYVLKSISDENGINKDDIEEVIAGAANQSGEDNRNVARMSALLADLPISVAGNTVNRLCASGLQSIIDASRAIRDGDGSLFLAGGVESMSRAPFVMAKAYSAFSRNVEAYDTTIGWRFTNPKLAEMYYPFAMGETAENVAEQYNVSRKDQDEFAYHSQRKWQEAHNAGKFKNEIIPIEVPAGKRETKIFDTDEHPRFSDLETLGKLRAAFRDGGTVTAGNSSGINDGAAAVILCSQTYAEKNGLKPMARIVSKAVAGVDPAIMGMGPVPATQKALQRAGLSMADIDLIELNEAFAAQSLACIRELDLDPEKVNIHGGSIAIGHPLGCSGTRITTTLLHALQDRGARYGLATMCVGVGQGAALIVENLR